MVSNHSKITIQIIAMNNNSLSVFEFESQDFRVLVKDGDPWFVVKDIARYLGIRDSSDLTKRIKNYEKGTDIVSTPGGNQEVAIVSESGLFRIMMTSRKEEAEPFQDWIAQEVLPSIRKTGSYSLAQPQTSLEVLQATINNLVAIEKRQSELERQQMEHQATLARLEANRIQAEEELSLLPFSEDKPNDIPVRGAVNMLVRSHAQRTNAAYHLTWSTLYQQMYYRYSYDVKARAKNRNMKPMDVIEADGMMDKLHAIASEMLA